MEQTLSEAERVKEIEKVRFESAVRAYQIKTIEDRNEAYFELSQTYDSDLVKEMLEEKYPVDSLQSREIVLKNKPPVPVVLPGTGKLISNYIVELAAELRERANLFYRIDSKSIVEVGEIKDKDGKKISEGFKEVRGARFITVAEEFIVPGVDIWNDHKKKNEFYPKSMSVTLSDIILQSEVMQTTLPRIDRIFPVPLPILYKGHLTFPKRGYDARFNSWLPFSAPNIDNPSMTIEEAKALLKQMYSEFCFKSDADYVNAIAGLLTPFLRGLFSQFNTRCPVYVYVANRERSGKDYTAGIVSILYEGNAIEEAPISNSEHRGANNTDELRKKVLSAFIAGRKRMHFSNNKGHIDNAVFESVITAEKFSDRALGRNDLLTFENELDFSLSGNIGITFTPDLANRCRFIRLFLDIEDANSRQFDNPDLHGWVKKNRGLILSALYALVNNWINKGSPSGKINFASFPEWARVCGGIMECAGYESPCAPDVETLSLGADSETSDMKQLFEIVCEKSRNNYLTKNQIRQILEDSGEDIFAYFDFMKKADQIKFGLKLIKFEGRVLSNIRMEVHPEDKYARSARKRYRFNKQEKGFGNVGNVGNELTHLYKSNFSTGSNRITLPTLPTLPTSEFV